MYPLQCQPTLIPKGFAVYAPDELIFIEQRQRKVAVTAFRCGYVAFNLIIEVE